MKAFLHAVIDAFDDVWIRTVLGVTRLVPGRPGNMLGEPVRRALVAFVGARIGRGSEISPGFMVFRRGRFAAGEGCRFGYDFRVWNFEPLTIGKGLLASHGVKVICGTHRVGAARENVAGPVSIGDNVWLGADVTIVGPCRIDNDVIVGAHSFVTGELEAGWIYAGTPARRIRRVDQDAQTPKAGE